MIGRRDLLFTKSHHPFTADRTFAGTTDERTDDGRSVQRTRRRTISSRESPRPLNDAVRAASGVDCRDRFEVPVVQAALQSIYTTHRDFCHQLLHRPTCINKPLR